MKPKHFFLSLLFIAIAMNATAQKFQVPYSGTTAVEDYIYEIPKSALPASFDEKLYAVQYEKNLYPIEKSVDILGNVSYISIINITTDRRGRVVVPTVTLVKSDVSNSYPKRTYAEIAHKTGGEWVRNPKRRTFDYRGGDWIKTNYIRVPDKHTDGTGYIKYEGPGWESDKIAYRFYLDWRNATDIFGKLKPDICLHRVGANARENYHEMQDWGMDIFKVGGSLGVGAFGYWTGNRAFRLEIYDSIISQVTADGKIRSQVKTNYYGWDYNDKRDKINLTSVISIDAGSRASHQQLLLSKSIENICTGLARDQNGEYIEYIDKSGKWSYIATWGKQSLNEPSDNLGIAVFFRNKNLKEITSDRDSWVVVLTPENQFLDYYFLGAWELEPNGITTKAQFVEYLNLLTKTLK
ncbi:MAG: DUF4861 domain-containing protein [Bacteroidales bacterium]|nr:DUF4861 domain-containing protein [Bacteroidales bacterium]